MVRILTAPRQRQKSNKKTGTCYFSDRLVHAWPSGGRCEEVSFRIGGLGYEDFSLEREVNRIFLKRVSVNEQAAEIWQDWPSTGDQSKYSMASCPGLAGVEFGVHPGRLSWIKFGSGCVGEDASKLRKIDSTASLQG